MFTKGEIKRNLLGGLEVALFMPTARVCFGNGKEEAIRSFAIPILFLPMSLAIIYMQPVWMAMKTLPDFFTLLFCLRTAITTALFLGCVYLISKKLKRLDYFNQFIIAVNWLTVPSVIVFLPIMIMLMTGSYTWTQIYPLAVCVVIYNYIFIGFMATYVLRLPWEMGGFIAFIGFMIENSADNLFHAVNQFF